MTAAPDAPAGAPLRILFVTPRFAPLVGGVEHHVNEVARRLAAKGCRVRVLTTDRTGELPAKESVAGVEIVRVPAWPRERDYYFAPRIYSEIVGDPGWDVVHVQSYHTLVAPLAMLAAGRARIPYVVTFHGGGQSSRTRESLRGLQWRLLRPLLRRAARLIAVAEFEIGAYGKLLGVPASRFELISNGVDLPAVTDPPATSGTVIASVGRLERYKGHHRVLAALPHVVAERPDVRLWIAGTGPYEAALREQAAGLGMAERVEIRAIPAEERTAMAEALAASALVVLLSEFETQPLAILEAAALGRPALVADTSGLSELGRRGLAVTIPLESSAEDVAAAVIRQLDAPHVPRRESLPTWDDCAARLMQLYERVARMRGRGNGREDA